MNIPLKAPCDRSDLSRKRGNAMADAAQRDLFEYFAPPQTAASAPPLAADVLLAEAPDAAAAVVDEDVTWDDQARHDQARHDPARHDQARHDQAWHDQIPAWPDDLQDDEILHHETEPSAEISAYDPGTPATHCEVVALGEASQANLRRLETTLSWLESEVEACRLPPATPLPQIPGLPVVGPIIDRSTLDRTLHRAPPLPAWLREPPATRPPGPPPHSRVFWPRVAKFLVACAIAAPLAYFFAVMPSPLQKRLAEIAGMASLDSPVVRPPEPRHRFRMSRAGPELAPDAPSLAPALPTLVEVEPRSSPELRTTEAAVPTPAVPVQSAQAEGPQVEAPRIEALRDEAPRVEAGNARITIRQPATAVAEDVDPSAVAVPASPMTGRARDVKLLIEQGRQFFDVGDLVAARILFLRAANAGDATAAVAMGATYDPVVLADRGVLGPAADLDQARRWYERAKEMGSPEGPRRLEMLANR
jgi:hypothetical protein